MEGLQKVLDDINKKLENIHQEQSAISVRLSQVEKNCLYREDLDNILGSQRPCGPSSQTAEASSIPRRSDALSPVDTSPTGESISTAELQRSYDIIKDSLIKVSLPEDLRVYDAKTGISKDCQGTLAVLSKCSRYTETALKQLSVTVESVENRDGRVNISDLKKLFTILHAEVGYLQGEYTNLMVKSKFDDNTASLFKCFEKNQAAFSDQSLNHLRCAAEISAIGHRQAPRGRGSRGNHGGRGRGFFNRQQSDTYHSFTNRDFPTRRWNNPQQPSQRNTSVSNNDE